MGKTMARIKDGVVANLEWVDDNVTDTDTFKSVYDLQIQIGDTYTDGKFYRNGVEVITFREQIQNALASYDAALTEIASYIPATMSVSDSDTDFTSINGRKQIILNYLTDVVDALKTLEVLE